jgi:uroporphyrinogen III methyltransferase/synthase
MTSIRTDGPATGPGSVALVGAGPGDSELLTLRGAELLGAADVVVADRRMCEPVLHHCRPDAEIVDVADPATDQDVASRLVELAGAGRRVVRLLPGDPFLLGTGAAEADALARAKVSWQLVPGVSAALAVPAYAGVPPTAADAASSVTVAGATCSAGADPVQAADWRALGTGTGTVVLLGDCGGVGKAATRLLEQGRAGNTPVAVIAAGTTALQRTVVSTLDQVEADVTGAGLSGSTVTVVGSAVDLRERLSWFETRPLFGWTVLVPRTKEQAGALSARLRALGATPVEVPTISVEPPRTPAPLDRAIKGLVSGRYQWIAFTSVNAVRAVWEKLAELALDARAFAGVRVAALGPATADALLAVGIRPELVPSGEQSSEGLLAEWAHYDPELDPIDRVFLPRTDIATETLVAGLKERGWAVDDVTAYRTVRAAPPPVEIREALKGGGFDAVLFTSSSTVRNLVGIAGKPHESTVLAAIGPRTVETAQELGLRVDVVAPTASIPGLVEALGAFALQRREAGGTGELATSKTRRRPARKKAPVVSSTAGAPAGAPAGGTS